MQVLHSRLRVALKGRKQKKSKGKKNKTRPRLKTKMTQKEFAQLKALWNFADCGSLMIVLVNALPSKNVFEGICSISTCSYCQLFLFDRVTCDNCRGQRPPLQELAKFDGTRSQLQSAASLLFHFLPKRSLSNLFKIIYLLSPTQHDLKTSGCVEKNGVAKRGARTGTMLAEIMHEAVFKKYVKFSCMSSQQGALIDCASMTSSARCLSGPSMPATAWSKSLWAGTPQRSCIKRKSKFCT